MNEIEFGHLYEIRIEYVVRTQNVIFTPQRYKIIAVEKCTEVENLPNQHARIYYFKALSQDGIVSIFYQDGIFIKISK